MGRHQELTEVKRQMERSRLLTLTGPGGVGKTRLSLQAGEVARRAFPDGVWVVDLTASEDPLRLGDVVAAALGVADHSARAVDEQLIDHLQDCSLLMVMDNCEHVLEPCARLVDTLLRAAPGLRVLATSRQPLGIDGERVLTVAPLPVPDPCASHSPEALAGFGSVALLLDRVEAVQPSFELTSDNAGAVARLCSRLDGLPLAIELAATRLRTLSVAQAAARLDDRFRLLSHGSPAAVSRQQTLRALIDWSHELCSRLERALWARLSVFPGSFDLEAVEHICSSEELDADDVLDALDGLVAKSVVTAQPLRQEVRYRLLETIRQYGRERLADQDGTATYRRRHRDHYLRVAELGVQRWWGGEQAEILARMRADHDNLEAALDWSIHTEGEEPCALRLASALRYHWLLGGFLSTGRRRLDQALSVSEDVSAERGQALWVTAWVAHLQGDSRTARHRLAECAAIADARHDVHLSGYVAVLSGTGALFAGELDDAIASFERGIAVLRNHRDTASELWAQFQLGVALSHAGRNEQAREVCTEAIGRAEAAGETWARSEAMWALAFDRWLVGDPDGSAADLTLEALALTPERNHVSTVLGLELLAWILASQGHAEEAARALGAADAVWTAFGASIAAFGPVFTQHSVRCRDAIDRALDADVARARFEEGRARPADLDRLRPGRPSSQPRPPVSEEPGPVETLTPREYDVAKLIARGMTNKAIAGELVLSRRTVDGHVERLYSKIGVSKRAQVATWLAEHDRLTASPTGE